MGNKYDSLTSEQGSSRFIALLKLLFTATGRAVLRFLWLSHMFHFLDKCKLYFQFLFYAYLIFPLFVNIDSLHNCFISNLFIDLIRNNELGNLTSMYLLAPLLALFFKEHDNVITGFVGNYDLKSEASEEESKQKQRSLLDHNKDAYDVMPQGKKLWLLMANERVIESAQILENFLQMALIVGNKRKNGQGASSIIITIIIGMLIVGILLSGADRHTQSFAISAVLLLVIMSTLLFHIFYIFRTAIKSSLYNEALDAAYSIMQSSTKEDTAEAFTHS